MDASEPFSLAQSTGELTSQLALAVDLGDIAVWRCDLGGERLASRADVELHVAVDGACGVAPAAQLLPDLILPGMQLPDCDGFEMLRRLRARPATALIPCAALSANAMPGPVERALTAGPAAS